MAPSLHAQEEEPEEVDVGLDTGTYLMPEDLEVPLEIDDSLPGDSLANDSLFSWMGSGVLYDSSDVALRTLPSASQLEAYLDDDRFNYDPEGYSRDPSFAEEVMRVIGDILEAIFGERSGAAFRIFFEALPWILLAVSLFLLLRAVIGQQAGGLFRRNRVENRRVIDEEIADIHALDFPTLIAGALERGEYRAAVRYHYLALLQTLSSAERIDWRPEKTNGAYLAELRGTPLYEPMRSLTLFFDYVWYGEFAIGREEYDDYRRDVESIDRLLSRSGGER